MKNGETRAGGPRSLGQDLGHVEQLRAMVSTRSTPTRRKAACKKTVNSAPGSVTFRHTVQ